MSSILTNASAMTALKSLQMTNKALEQTQARISTGYRVAGASDNAAYWSIATTMRSDNKALLISGVDAALQTMTTSASDLGAAKKRISLQTDFVNDLMDAIERGVGTLVDANMNEESTRLQALQVQQQLGIQGLSIANASVQGILSLFKG